MCVHDEGEKMSRCELRAQEDDRGRREKGWKKVSENYGREEKVEDSRRLRARKKCRRKDVKRDGR
jgi:hypothetical protein